LIWRQWINDVRWAETLGNQERQMYDERRAKRRRR
jgi:hypothetical protein